MEIKESELFVVNRSQKLLRGPWDREEKMHPRKDGSFTCSTLRQCNLSSPWQAILTRT